MCRTNSRTLWRRTLQKVVQAVREQANRPRRSHTRSLSTPQDCAGAGSAEPKEETQDSLNWKQRCRSPTMSVIETGEKCRQRAQTIVDGLGVAALIQVKTDHFKEHLEYVCDSNHQLLRHHSPEHARKGRTQTLFYECKAAQVKNPSTKRWFGKYIEETWKNRRLIGSTLERQCLLATTLQVCPGPHSTLSSSGGYWRLWSVQEGKPHTGKQQRT